ncbi:MAG: D-cysteine desulfhydrase family protein, partial [Chloroflexi bacterium]|nr:D-cysteine desulfhydrase family protein [Chloroflexota bacterium]
AEAQTLRARTLITAGAVQSNHCRQTAAAAARFGFKCILVLTGDRPAKVSGNLLLDHLFGAEIIWTEKSQREAMLQQTFDQALGQGHKPYLVPYGGSSPTGALGYAFAMQELIQQMKDLRGLGDLGGLGWIVFASSSGGTQAGLVLGARLFGFGGKVLGISVDEPREELQERVAKLATETSERIGERIAFSPENVLVNADYCAAGYGVLTEAEHEAIQLFARYEGLLIDPVYTGRAAAGMIDLIRKGFFAQHPSINSGQRLLGKKDETVLFWHTGGTTALFAEKYQDALK